MELIVAAAILAILTMMALPLARVTIQREKEKQLRHALWEMRDAIDRYKDAADRQMFQTKVDSQRLSPRSRDAGQRCGSARWQENSFPAFYSNGPHDQEQRMGLAVHAGRSRFRLLGWTKRVRRLLQVGRYRARRHEVQGLVDATGREQLGSKSLAAFALVVAMFRRASRAAAIETAPADSPCWN